LARIDLQLAARASEFRPPKPSVPPKMPPRIAFKVCRRDVLLARVLVNLSKSLFAIFFSSFSKAGNAEWERHEPCSQGTRYGSTGWIVILWCAITSYTSHWNSAGRYNNRRCCYRYVHSMSTHNCPRTVAEVHSSNRGSSIHYRGHMRRE
jgi:hypothetical protein